MNVTFPFQIDPLGFVAEASYADHIEQMIEQILFTRPGERVNLPEFGCGVQSLVFGSTSPELAVAVRSRIEASIQKWLPGVVQVEAVDISHTDSTLEIQLRYALTRTAERRTARFRL